MAEYANIAVASTFSPRFLPLLAEAHRMAKRFGAAFSVLHAGPQEEKSERLFANAFTAFKFDPVPVVHWCKGNDPEEAITKTLLEQKIHLLILGALEKETPGRQFLGNVARRLMRSAPCSLLYLTKPRLEAIRLRTIVLAADNSAAARRALEIGKKLAIQDGAQKLHVVSVVTVFAQARAAHEGQDAPMPAEEERLREFVKDAGESPIAIDTRCIHSTTGFAASEFVQTIGADLLIVPSAPQHSATLFPYGMDWITDTIPTNLLVVRDLG